MAHCIKLFPLIVGEHDPDLGGAIDGGLARSVQ
jgi:hypothetical protein